jgi:Tol biopolymer transport system component
LGGATRPLRYLPFVAWAPDATRFAGATLSGKQIWFTETATGSTSSIELSGAFAFIYEIDWSPNGKVLTFRASDESDQHAIWTTTIDGGRQQVVVQSATALYSPRFSPRGDAIYYLSGDEQAKELQKVEIDSRTGEPEDDPVALLSGLQAGEQMAFSSDGRRLLYARKVSHTNLWLVTVQPNGGGVSTSQLTHGTFRHEAPRFSPDGTRMAMIRQSRSNPNIFVMSLADRQPEQLTFLTAEIWNPVWSTDGSEIAFGSTMGDAPKIWKIGARGGTPEPFGNSSPSQDLTWAPGSSILYQRPGNSAFHFLDPDNGDETPFMDDSGGGSADPLQFFSWMASPAYSPSGQQVAISCNCPDGEGVWVVSLRDSSRNLIHDDSETLPIGWSADGALVYALEPKSHRVLRIPTRGGKTEPLVDIPFERVGGVDITPDGTQIACAVPVTQGDIWLIENFDPELN